MRTKQPGINGRIIRHFWRMSLLERRTLVLALVFIPLNTLFLTTLVPFYVGKVLAGLSNSTADAMHYVPYLVAAAGLGVLAYYIGFRAFLGHQPKIMERLETEALDTLLKRSVGFHNNRIAGKLVADAGDYTSSYMQLSNVLFTTLIPIAVGLSSGILVVFLSSVYLGILVVIMTVSVIAFAIWQTVQTTANRERRHAARQAMIAQQADVITNSVTVKTFAREDSELAEHRRLNHKLATYRILDWRKAGGDGSLRIGILLAFEVAFILLIIHLVGKNPALLSIGIFTFSYVLNLANRLFDVGVIFRTIEDSLYEARDITNVIETELEIQDKPGATLLKVKKGTISFSKVLFRYHDAANDDTVFDNLSLNIKAGERVGLVGPSGGGKSTLSRLLLRFDDIQAGSIAIDGQDIGSVTQQSLRSNIAYVPQEPLLFHRSIFENIAYGAPDADLNAVREAARQAYALEFIEALPQGFDTIVGERGVKLSGGQRQRVAIARAMLKNAPILVLDEATSALDSESEVLIQKALWKLMEGRTAIVIAHRLSTIQKMDRILVMRSGKIVEQGSHKELVGKKDGVYAKLWAHQSGGFIDE